HKIFRPAVPDRPNHSRALGCQGGDRGCANWLFIERCASQRRPKSLMHAFGCNDCSVICWRAARAQSDSREEQIWRHVVGFPEVLQVLLHVVDCTLQWFTQLVCIVCWNWFCCPGKACATRYL